MPKFTALAAEYKSLWDTAVIRPARAQTVRNTVQTLLTHRADYETVSRATGVPWFFIGAVHNLEASFKNAHLHNGDPLSAQTVHVPRGRPLSGGPPFDWTASAIDALTMHGLQNIGRDNWSIERISYELERYNGFGYRNNFPNVKSPYLWSCTNHYTSGKYTGDHRFDPAAVSDQVGAMAVLKQLVADGVVRLDAQANMPPPQPFVQPPAVPVPTGMFFANLRPFGLRKEAKDDAERLYAVETNNPVKKLREVDADWLEVEVTAPAPDLTVHQGFARKIWLKPQTVLSSFVPEDFAEACLDAGAACGTNGHLLIALADAETSLTNKESPDGVYFGPYAISEDEWKAVNVPAETGFTDAGRFDPAAQATIAARFVVAHTKDASEILPDKRLPTAEEICLVRIFGLELLPKFLDAANQTRTVRDVLAPMPAKEIDAIFARRPGLFTAGITVKDLHKAIADRLDTGFAHAAFLIQKVQPDLSVGPPKTADDDHDVPWMVVAKEQLTKGIRETNPSNPEIEKYFVATTVGRPLSDDTAWCGAFISWCIKQSNGARSPLNYSARAADWLQNGKALEGPQYGAVVVTVPLAAGASGHVGFAESWDDTHVHVLGGNQGDMVKIAKFPIKVVRSWRMV